MQLRAFVALSVALAASASPSYYRRASDAFSLQNGADALQLNQQYETLSADSPCTADACVGGQLAKCTNGKFDLQPCGEGLICAAVPLVGSPGTNVTCTTAADRDALISATGADLQAFKLKLGGGKARRPPPPKKVPPPPPAKSTKAAVPPKSTAVRSTTSVKSTSSAAVSSSTIAASQSTVVSSASTSLASVVSTSTTAAAQSTTAASASTGLSASGISSGVATSASTLSSAVVTTTSTSVAVSTSVASSSSTSVALSTTSSAADSTASTAADSTTTSAAGSTTEDLTSTAASTSTSAAVSNSTSVVTSTSVATSTSIKTSTTVTTTSSAATSTSTATTNSTDPQNSLTLLQSVIATGFANDGQDQPTAGQVPSLTSTNNFINFCATVPSLPITNGKQIQAGSCNPAPLGILASAANMPSAKFLQPPNFGTVPANANFTVQLAVAHLETGHFTNAAENYFAAPQVVNAQGDVQGHSHVVIEQLTDLAQATPTDPTKFAFFKGLNDVAQDGVLSVVVPGLPAGVYRMASINSAANHQPALVAVAQHGALDDMIYFTVQ
ncbi:hypothetical protein GY45DRAFT_777326 [Cubamyces sp. BRFM 1775]|nr:hypothetical protein GY45DRAFT_777326 [Cubamyces sp. BRFM 1775]